LPSTRWPAAHSFVRTAWAGDGLRSLPGAGTGPVVPRSDRHRHQRHMTSREGPDAACDRSATSRARPAMRGRGGAALRSVSLLAGDVNCGCDGENALRRGRALTWH
jgi:hypothetical protein